MRFPHTVLVTVREDGVGEAIVSADVASGLARFRGTVQAPDEGARGVFLLGARGVLKSRRIRARSAAPAEPPEAAEVPKPRKPRRAPRD